jgi:hypothetical protein
MDTPITNITDLRIEISRLKELERGQGAAIRRRFSSLTTTFATIYSLFSGSTDADGTKKGIMHMDYVGLLSRILLPFTLNKTLFRNSGFIVKALVGLVSQKASGFITEDSVAGIWDKAKSLFTNLTSQSRERTPEHSGAPAFSETY